MDFEVLTKREVIQGVPERWKQQYFGLDGWRSTRADNREDTYHALKALDLASCTEADIEAVIGNRSWTRLECDGCEREVDKICFLRSHSQNEYGSCSYCKDCLAGALKAIED